MIILIFIIAFIIAYISIYIVSLFSWQSSDPISVFKTTLIIWWLSIILNIFWLTWIIWIFISTIVSMITFMKFLWFEPTPSFFAWLLYSVIYSLLVLMIISLLT